MSLRKTLKKIPFFLTLYWIGYASKTFLRLQIGQAFYHWAWFWKDYRSFRRLPKNEHFTPAFQPILTDKTTYTPIEPIYFHQDNWLAQKLFQHKPAHHYDVGSKAMTIALLSQAMPMTMIDIRPLPYSQPNLFFQEGTILALPFAEGSLPSLSSICVIEHIGLGRYGDPLDTWGSEKAFQELIRVLAVGGNFYFTVPVEDACRYYFNAHRTFTRDYILELCQGLSLQEEKYLYGIELFDAYDAKKGFGTGFFHFRKDK